MNNATTKKATQQFQSLFFSPARTYAEMTLDYSEKLMTTQLEAFKAYSNIALGQARAMLEIKNAEDLRAYTVSQQQAVKDLSERVKEDGEKVVSINQEFLQRGQNLAKEKAKKGRELAEDTVKKTQAETPKAADTKASHAQSTDTKASHAQSTDAKASHAQSTDTKASHAQSTDAKASQAQSTDTKGNHAQSTDTKGNHAQSTDTKGNHAQSTDTKGNHAQSTGTKPTKTK